MGETPQGRRPEPEEAEEPEPTDPVEPSAEEPEVVAHAVGTESEDGYGAQDDGGTAGWCIGAASAG